MQLFWTGLTMLIFLSAKAQIVDKGCIHLVELSDKTEVSVFRGFNDEGIHTYYYLPANLRLSIRNDKTPEFSFLTFKSPDGKEIEGAILHLLLTWGLTTEQEKEVENKLHITVDSLAVLAGVVSLQNPENISSFQIKGDSQLAKILNTRWSQEPVAPVLPGTKMALSYRLNADESKLFEEALSHPSGFTNILVEMVYTYRGGNKTYWYNLIKGDNYTLKRELKAILKPVLNVQNK